jgi:hypothetical protein
MEGMAKPPPAGWYEDPDDGELQRFWDGSRWTSSRMPRNPAVPLEGEKIEPLPQVRYPSDAPSPLAAPVPEAGLPTAAWYQDPENPQGMRYWDGAHWTEHKTDYLASAPAKKPVSEGMVAAGYITSFLFPIIGVVIGLIVMNRGNKNGRWIFALSLLFIAVFLVIGNIDTNTN